MGVLRVHTHRIIIVSGDNIIYDELGSGDIDVESAFVARAIDEVLSND